MPPKRQAIETRPALRLIQLIPPQQHVRQPRRRTARQTARGDKSRHSAAQRIPRHNQAIAFDQRHARQVFERRVHIALLHRGQGNATFASHHIHHAVLHANPIGRINRTDRQGKPNQAEKSPSFGRGLSLEQF
jgi:hypothetical protein